MKSRARVLEFYKLDPRERSFEQKVRNRIIFKAEHVRKYQLVPLSSSPKSELSSHKERPSQTSLRPGRRRLNKTTIRTESFEWSDAFLTGWFSYENRRGRHLSFAPEPRKKDMYFDLSSRRISYEAISNEQARQVGVPFKHLR